MRVVSGIQSSGKLHLGHYLGAMTQHIELQHGHECFFFIANYPSITDTAPGRSGRGRGSRGP